MFGRRRVNELFFPTDLKLNKAKFRLCKAFLVIPSALLMLYIIALHLLSKRVFDMGKIAVVISTVACVIAVLFMLALAVACLTDFENNRHTTVRTFMSVVSTAACMINGLLIIDILFVVSLFRITPIWLFFLLLVPFLIAFFVWGFTFDYKKGSKEFFDRFIRSMPILTLILAAFMVGACHTTYYNTNSKRVAFNEVKKVYTAVEYILTEDEYNVSFGSNNATKTVARALTDNKQNSISNYELICISGNAINLKAGDDITDSDFLDVSQLAKLDTLQSLTVSDFPLVKNITSLGVSSLTVDNCKLEQSNNIMHRLRTLKLFFSDASYESLIKCTPFINSLSIGASSKNADLTMDLKIISKLSSLKYLSLAGMSFKNLSDVNIFKNLEYLYLESVSKDKARVKIHSLEKLKEIATLSVEIENFSSMIEANPELTYVSVIWGGVKDISAVAGLENLSYLSLVGNGITDISPVGSMKSLKSINLSYNEISDISALSTLENLNELYLSNNNIEDISPLSGLYNLVDVDLSHNYIKVIPYLSCGKTLEEIDISYNSISDISVFADFENLTSIATVGNNL